MARDRKAMKKALLKRQQESYERRKDSGKFKSFFREDLAAGVVHWKCSANEHVIDIIPYIAGGNDPHNAKGELCYVLDIFVHGGVGVNEDSYICLARSYNKSCPICEYQKKLKEEGAEEDLIISLNPTRRTVYNIVCYDDEKEQAKGVQVWTVAHRYMEKLLTPLGKKRGGGLIMFTDPDEGKSISFERSGMGQTSTDYIGHKFEDRDYVISEEILDGAHCLDDLIHIPTYEEVSTAFYGEKGQEESVEEEIVEEEEPVEEIPEKEESTEAEEEKSKKEEIEIKRKRRKIEKAKKDESKKEDTTGPKCPGGGEFGVDLDKLGTNCDNCELWDDCAKRSDELEEEENLK